MNCILLGEFWADFYFELIPQSEEIRIIVRGVKGLDKVYVFIASFLGGRTVLIIFFASVPPLSCLASFPFLTSDFDLTHPWAVECGVF